LVLFPNRDKLQRLAGNLSAYKDLLTGAAPRLRHISAQERDLHSELRENSNACSAE